MTQTNRIWKLGDLAGGDMIVNLFRRQKGWAIGGAATVVGVSLLWATVAARDSRASWPWQCASSAGCQRGCQPYFVGDGIPPGELGGTWYWLRTAEEEKQRHHGALQPLLHSLPWSRRPRRLGHSRRPEFHEYGVANLTDRPATGSYYSGRPGSNHAFIPRRFDAGRSLGHGPPSAHLCSGH